MASRPSVPVFLQNGDVGISEVVKGKIKFEAYIVDVLVSVHLPLSSRWIRTHYQGTQG